jgi:hypothetical protein
MDRYIETAKCAYSAWERAGRPEGMALDNWLQAEAQLAATPADDEATTKGATKDRNIAIAQCAYGLWERAGRPEGKAIEHWLEAEAELAAAPAPQNASLPSAPAVHAPKSKHVRNAEVARRSVNAQLNI